MSQPEELQHFQHFTFSEPMTDCSLNHWLSWIGWLSTPSTSFGPTHHKLLPFIEDFCVTVFSFSIMALFTATNWLPWKGRSLPLFLYPWLYSHSSNRIITVFSRILPSPVHPKNNCAASFIFLLAHYSCCTSFTSFFPHSLPFMYCPEDGCSMVPLHTGIYIPVYMASWCRRCIYLHWAVV